MVQGHPQVHLGRAARDYLSQSDLVQCCSESRERLSSGPAQAHLPVYTLAGLAQQPAAVSATLCMPFGFAAASRASRESDRSPESRVYRALTPVHVSSVSARRLWRTPVASKPACTRPYPSSRTASQRPPSVHSLWRKNRSSSSTSNSSSSSSCNSSSSRRDAPRSLRHELARALTRCRRPASQPASQPAVLASRLAARAAPLCPAPALRARAYQR